MSDKEQQLLSRRKFIEGSSAALIAAAGLRDASAQQANVPRSPDHHLPNESEQDRTIPLWIKKILIRNGLRPRMKAGSRRSSTPSLYLTSALSKADGRGR